MGSRLFCYGFITNRSCLGYYKSDIRLRSQIFNHRNFNFISSIVTVVNRHQGKNFSTFCRNSLTYYFTRDWRGITQADLAFNYKATDIRTNLKILRGFSLTTSTMSVPDVNVSRELKLPPLNTTHGAQDVSNSPELQEAISACSTCLLNGGVISVPTDTIYGIAGLSQNIDAVNRIYDIKQRNFQNPLAISVGEADDIYRWSKVTVPHELLTDLLPGPVTVVFDRSPELNPSLNPHASKVGIRIPGNAFMQELAKKCGSPIALTSANISGGRSCLQIEEFQHLWPQLDLVVNGGVLNDTEESRLGSTVVDLSDPGTFRIIRNGSAHVQTIKILQDKFNLKNSTSLPKGQR